MFFEFQTICPECKSQKVQKYCFKGKFHENCVLTETGGVRLGPTDMPEPL